MQHRPRFPRLKRLAANLVCNRWTGAVVTSIYGEKLPFAGIEIFVPKRGISNCSRAAIYWGIYESAERRFIERYLLPDLPTIELGSSLGGVSSHIAKALQPGQELICVEANPRLIETLELNLKQHASHLKSKVVHAAVHYDGPTCHFVVSEDHLVSAVDHRSSTSIEINAIRLQDLGPSMEGRDFQLVCDIEGAESQLLAFDGLALASCRRMIIELHDNIDLNASIPRLLDEILALHAFRMLDHYGPVYVFENVSELDAESVTSSKRVSQGL